MKKRNKIIITMLMVITMLSVMAVSTFASGNVLQGAEGGSVDTSEIVGTWVFHSILDFANTEAFSYSIDFTSNGTTYETLKLRVNSSTTKMLQYYWSSNDGINAYTYNSNTWSNDNYKTILISNYDTTEEAEILEFLNTYATKTAPIIGGSSTVGILDVASEIPSFLVNVFVPLISIFYADGAFTIIGVLSLAVFAFFLILLLFQVIKRFVQFRG